jgi:large subunit ribosomal protein L6
MSRIGKKIINIPEKTEVTSNAGVLTVKGPKGTLVRELPSDISLVIADRTVTLTPRVQAEGEVENENIEALWGTVASHVVNMVEGVNKPFTKKLIVEGIGFKGELKGTDLVLSLGFSHPVKVSIPSTLKVTIDKAGAIEVSGADKDEVGQFAAAVRAMKKPEPYKGKGIHYDGEIVRRKQGKKSV